MFDFFFSRPGNKLRMLAKIMFVILCIGGIVTGAVLIINDLDYMDTMFYIGILVIVMTPVFAWLLTLPLYAFGNLVETNESIDRKLSGQGGAPASQENQSLDPRQTELRMLFAEGLISREERDELRERIAERRN